ncbi:MAG: hypothetical protein HKN12_08885, partial [Gemmatimonadetes bacterium]|nr:hypothetical protein [Gemmatimonadota bacterium]
MRTASALGLAVAAAAFCFGVASGADGGAERAASGAADAATGTAPVAAAAGFDHALHDGYFPDCVVCHGSPGRSPASWVPSLPEAESCAACHDGAVQDRVPWTGPGLSAPTNLRFDHSGHAAAVRNADPDAEAVNCAACHGDPQVVRADAGACLSCHGETEHFADATNCATCHLPMSDAPGIPESRIAEWPRPPGHDVPGFAGGGHGALATATCPADGGAPANCAVCHSRTFCLNCHVDAPERPEIAALALDDRSRVHQASLVSPGDHAEADFLAMHGHSLGEAGAACATCHTEESCRVCHVAGAVSLSI